MFTAYGQDTLLALLNPLLQGISLILGEPSNNPLVLTGRYMDEEEQFRQNLETNNATANFTLCMERIEVAVPMGEYAAAERACKDARRFHSREALAGVELSMYESLVALALYRETKASRHLRMARKCLRYLRKCAKEAPHNFQHKVYFVEAELAAVKGSITDALTLYRLAINFAEDTSNLHNAAMYCERRAVALRFCSRDKESIRSLKQARDFFERWGAVIAVDRLDNSLQFDYNT